MTDQDIFFTHTIVGQPMSVELGKPLVRTPQTAKSGQSGLMADLGHNRFWLDGAWKEWCLVTRAFPPASAPRRRPGATRRWLERHALRLAIAALLLMGSACAMVTIAFWPVSFMTWLSAVLARGL